MVGSEADRPTALSLSHEPVSRGHCAARWLRDAMSLPCFLSIDVMAKGFLYILRNEAMPGLLKIGYSVKVPTERVDELPLPKSTPMGHSKQTEVTDAEQQ